MKEGGGKVHHHFQPIWRTADSYICANVECTKFLCEVLERAYYPCSWQDTFAQTSFKLRFPLCSISYENYLIK